MQYNETLLLACQQHRMVAHFNPKMVLKRSRYTFSQYTSLLAQPACLPFPLASSTQYFGAVIGGHQSYQSSNREREREGERDTGLGCRVHRLKSNIREVRHLAKSQPEYIKPPSAHISRGPIWKMLNHPDSLSYMLGDSNRRIQWHNIGNKVCIPTAKCWTQRHSAFAQENATTQRGKTGSYTAQLPG